MPLARQQAAPSLAVKEEHLQSVTCHVLSRVTCHMSRSNAPQAPGHQELLSAEGVVGAAVAAAASSSTTTSAPHCLGCCRGPSSASAAASEPADEVGQVAEETLHRDDCK